MRIGQATLAFVLLTVVCAAAHAAEKGLVAHYAFEEGKGALAKDESGNGNDGTIKGGAAWVKGPWGTALAFDGKDDYVDCGTGKSLNIAGGGTVMVWVHTTTKQGGLVNWSTGRGWNDERLVFAVSTYHGGATMGCMADGNGSRGFSGFGDLLVGQWLHLVYTFDGTTITIYRDGMLSATAEQSLTPKVAGVPLWIGRCQGLGKEYFHGFLDEVRIYNRPLSAVDVLSYYKRTAPKRGKDMTVFERVGVEAQVYPAPAKVMVPLDARGLQPLPEGAKLHVDLTRQGGRKTRMQRDVSDVPTVGTAEVMFDVAKLTAGKCVVRARAIGPDGAIIGKPSSVTIEWPGRPDAYRNIKILNNLCWELLNEKAGVLGVKGRKAFSLPVDRWILIRSTAEVGAGGAVRVIVNSDKAPAITHTAAGESELEGWRYLKAGDHVVRIETDGKARAKQLIVRAVPALQHAFYGSAPQISAYGPHDWEFLKKDVRPNVNVMVSGATPKPEHIKSWLDSGRAWIQITGKNIPGLDVAKPDAVDVAYKYWAASPGYQQPLMSGVIVDEFSGGDHPQYDIYRKAIERLNKDFPGRMFMPYGGRFYGKDRSTKFAQAALDSGGYVCPEHYLIEQPTPEAAQRFIYNSLVPGMAKWEDALPGSTPRVLIVLGYLSHPTESLNHHPTVDFKVYMDMQVRLLATHPAFFGLGGIQEYHASYCDEENVRWAGRLYRHYALEGNTAPVTDDPYILTHIQNPDFTGTTDGWTVTPAEAGSVATKSHPGYSWLESRYPRTKVGDTFLWMKRSAKAPNVFTQEIRNLKPGRLYSMKLITADYQNLITEKSEKKLDAVSIRLDGVDVDPAPNRNFQFTFPNCYAHHLGKFTDKHNYWMNYHWRVFRAKGTTARLTVSDWKSDKEPGGPVGQELMYNFIEVQPYFE